MRSLVAASSAVAFACLAPGALWAQGEPAPEPTASPPEPAGLPVAPASEAPTPAPERPTLELPRASRRLRLDECIRIARESNEELARADAKIDEARAQKRKLRGRFGPVVRAEANVMRWDEPTYLDFSSALPASLQGLLGDMPPMTIQEATTYGLQLVLAQPVTSLWTVWEGYTALALGEQAASQERAAARSQVADKVAEAYFQALTATEYAQIAAVAVDTIRAHVARAKLLAAREVIADHQVLEAEVRLAEAESQLIQATEGVDLARRNLAFQMGQPVEEPVEPVPVREQDLPSAGAEDDAAVAQAIERRPDLAAIRTRVEQAEAGVRAAWAQMLPEVNLLAGAVYNKGSEFQREASYFVGAKASWNLWEWGATYYGIEEAEAKVRQAASGRTQLEQGVRLEVRKAQSDLRTAKRQLAVAKRAVAQADENLRIVQRRYDQSASTSTDVLDAVTLRQRAKTNEANALHAAFRAAHALRRATGAPVAPGPRREGGEP